MQSRPMTNLLLTVLLTTLLSRLAVGELLSITWDHTARAELEFSERPTHPGAFNGCFIDPSDDYVPRGWDGDWSYPNDGLNCAVESQFVGTLTDDQITDPYSFSTQTRAESVAVPGTRGVQSRAGTSLEFRQGPSSTYFSTDLIVEQKASAVAFVWLPSQDQAGAASVSATNEVVFVTDPTLEYIGPVEMSLQIRMAQDETLTSGFVGSFEVFDYTDNMTVFSHSFENIETIDGFRPRIVEQIPFDALLGHEIGLRFSYASAIFKEVDERGRGVEYSVDTRITGLQLVPEPGSAWLLISAGLTAVAKARRRTRLPSTTL